MISQSPDLQAFVRLSRTYPATRERVFHAWTDSQALENWFKPFGMPVTVARLDLRIGGQYQFNIHMPGGIVSAISGHYVEIRPPEKLVFTWASEATGSIDTLVTIHFTERSAATELTLVHERFARPEYVPPHLEGWTSMFDGLDGMFAN